MRAFWANGAPYELIKNCDIQVHALMKYYMYSVYMYIMKYYMYMYVNVCMYIHVKSILQLHVYMYMYTVLKTFWVHVIVF